jgi:hypothetical protein
MVRRRIPLCRPSRLAAKLDDEQVHDGDDRQEERQRGEQQVSTAEEEQGARGRHNETQDGQRQTQVEGTERPIGGPRAPSRLSTHEPGLPGMGAPGEHPDAAGLSPASAADVGRRPACD